MAYLVLPPRTLRQPLGRPRIRWNDDLANGLVLASAGCYYDAVQGQYATLTGSPTIGPSALVNGDVGVTQVFASSQRITFNLPEGMVRPMTVAVIGNWTDRGAAEDFATVHNAASTTYYGILGRGDTGGNQAQAASSGGSFRARISIGSAYAARRVIVSTFAPGPLNVGDPEYNIYIDGQAGTSYSVASNPLNDVAVKLNSGSYTGTVSMFGVWNRVLEAAEVRALGVDNWQVFARDVRRVYFVGPSAGSSVTGVAAITLGDVTSAAAGTLGINAAAGITLGSVTLSAAGKLALSGAAAVTLGNVTSTGTGTLALAGTAGITLGAVSLASAGSLTDRGALAVTLGNITLTATGGSTNTGAAAITLGDVTTASAASLGINAQLGGTLDAVTLAATGSVLVSGAAAVTLGAITLASTGVLGSTVTGTASIALGNVTLASAASLTLAGSAAIALGNVTSAGAGTLALSGSANIVLGSVTTVASGSVAIRGQMLATLGNVTLGATGHYGEDAALFVDPRFIARYRSSGRTARTARTFRTQSP